MSPLVVGTVIPTFNEGDRAAGFIQQWAAAAVRHTSLRVIAIVVDDGSQAECAARHRDAVDDAADALTRAGVAHEIRFVRSETNLGKGAAIRHGWSLMPADAVWLSFVDGDGAYPAREYWRMADTLATLQADVLCASRADVPGRTVERSAFRHVQGRTFATAVQWLFHLGLHDTQAGLKFFRGSHLRPLLPTLRENRWLLDIEVLTQLKATGSRFEEMPVDCHMRAGSTLVFGLDPMRMLAQLVRLRLRGSAVSS